MNSVHKTTEWFGVYVLLRRKSLVLCISFGVAQLVEALRYKPEGRGFESRWCNWNISLS